MNVQAWVTAVSAIVALVVGVGGIFRDEIVRAVRGPRIRLSFDPDDLVDAHITTMSVHTVATEAEFTSPCFYLRVRANNTGGMTAEMVEIMIKSVERIQGTGAYKPDTKFLPLALRWSFVGTPCRERIAAGVSKHCDVLHIAGPLICRDPVAILDLEALPGTGGWFLFPGRYRITLLVSGANCRTVENQVELTVPSEWTDDPREFIRRLGMTGLPTSVELSIMSPREVGSTYGRTL